MLNGAEQATVTDLAYTLKDTRTGEANPQWIHTMLYNNTADTMYVDPLPTTTSSFIHCLLAGSILS